MSVGATTAATIYSMRVGGSGLEALDGFSNSFSIPGC